MSANTNLEKRFFSVLFPKPAIPCNLTKAKKNSMQTWTLIQCKHLQLQFNPSTNFWSYAKCSLKKTTGTDDSKVGRKERKLERRKLVGRQFQACWTQVGQGLSLVQVKIENWNPNVLISVAISKINNHIRNQNHKIVRPKDLILVKYLPSNSVVWKWAQILHVRNTCFCEVKWWERIL